MTVLVTAAASSQAHQLKSKLENSEIQPQDILLGDHLPLPVFMLSSGKMVKLPNPETSAYQHEMLTLCLDRNIGKVYVLRRNEAKLLAEAYALFTEFSIEIINITDEV